MNDAGVFSFRLFGRISCNLGKHRVDVFDVTIRISNENNSGTLLNGNTQFFELLLSLLKFGNIFNDAIKDHLTLYLNGIAHHIYIF